MMWEVIDRSHEDDSEVLEARKRQGKPTKEGG